MFTYKNGRFHLGSSSFALPENCFVDTKLPLESSNGMLIKPLDQSFQIYLDGWITGRNNRCGLDRDNWAVPVQVFEKQFKCGTGYILQQVDSNSVFYNIHFPMSEDYIDEKGYE